MRFELLVKLGHLILSHRKWFEDLGSMNGCSCRAQPAEPCSYRDAYPEEHALVEKVLALLDGRDVEVAA